MDRLWDCGIAGCDVRQPLCRPAMTNKLRFAVDFFFTDLMNHVEFMKWTMTLGKEDDILLVVILERLVSFSNQIADNDAKTKKKNDSNGGSNHTSTSCASAASIPIQPFYSHLTTHKDLPKNPLNVAIAYSQLKSLKAHEYNIFETAFLHNAPGGRYLAYLAFAIELLFFGILLVHNTYQRIWIGSLDQRDIFIPVVMVMVISTTLFAFVVKRHYLASRDFNAAVCNVMNLHDHGRGWLLKLNTWCNQYLGVCILVFNVYFILVSATPIDAILDAIALGFIMDIDDTLAPPWDEDRIEDELAANVHNYIQQPFAPSTLHVQRLYHQQQRQQHTNGQRLHIPYKSHDHLYIRLHDDDKKTTTTTTTAAAAGEAEEEGVGGEHTTGFYVTVYRSNCKAEDLVTTEYEEIIYHVHGEQAPAFQKALGNFRCLVSFQDIHS